MLDGKKTSDRTNEAGLKLALKLGDKVRILGLVQRWVAGLRRIATGIAAISHWKHCTYCNTSAQCPLETCYPVASHIEPRRILRSQGLRGRIVELRGPLGPGGAEIFRVRVWRKPKPHDIEVRADQLEAIPAGN